MSDSQHEVLDKEDHEVTVQYYRSTLSTELSNHCLQFTSPEGDLGTGGVGAWAYLQYRLANDSSPETRILLLQTTRDACLQHLQQSTSKKNTKNSHQSMSFMTNPTIGVETILAATFRALGEESSSQKHVEIVLKTISKLNVTFPRSDCDWMYGRAGALQAIFWLRRELNNPNLGQSVVLQVARSIITEGLTCAQQQSQYQLPLLWQWRSTFFAGAAHGIVGIMYTLLGLTSSELDALEARLFPNVRAQFQSSLEALMDHYSDILGNLPITLTDPNAAVSSTMDMSPVESSTWAHGAAGYIWLLVRAHQVFGEHPHESDLRAVASPYLKRAIRLADDCLWAKRGEWMHPSSTASSNSNGNSSIGLTTGRTGVAYVFLLMGQATGRPIWNQRAAQVTRYTVQHWNQYTLSALSQRPYSLLEGLGGLVFLLLDLGATDILQFPGYASEPTTTRNTAFRADSETTAETMLENGTVDEIDGDTDEEDEFGDTAGGTILPDTNFLQSLESEIAREDKISIPHVTPSQLLAQLPVGLDKSQHDDIGELTGSRHLFLDDINDNDDADEFGDADEQDQAVHLSLHSSVDTMNASEGDFALPLKVTPSQLQAHIPAGLDKEKHHEISELMDSRHEFDYENDEFGDADEQDLPDQRYLHNFHDTMNLSQVDISMPWKVTPSQLQPHIPAGLDREKHDEISGLMDSRHEFDYENDEFGDAAEGDMPSPQYLRRAQDSMKTDGRGQEIAPKITPSQLQAHIPAGLDKVRHYEIGGLVDSHIGLNDDDEEFGDAEEGDLPSSQYLRQAQDSMKTDESSVKSSARVTPSQLQAMLPSGLDGEKHDDIGGLSDSRHEFEFGESDDEFGDADEYDQPVKQFLSDSIHSIPSIHIREESPLISIGGRKRRPSGLDGGKHEDLGDLVESKYENEEIDCDDEEEFGKALDGERAIDSCIDRWKQSFNDDQDFQMADVEYGDLNDALPHTKEATLDVETHEDLGRLMDSHNVSGDENEFEVAGQGDQPVQKYLRAQNSMYGDDIAMGPPSLSGLDNESHNDLGGFLGITVSDDEDEFVMAGKHDQPNQTFLQSQISLQDEPFLSSDEIAETEADTHRDEGQHTGARRLSKHITNDQDRAPASPRKFFAMSSGAKERKIRLVSKGQMIETKKINTAFLRDCLDASRGDGNIFGGGVGVSSFLRLKRSYTETGARQTASLRRALNNAKNAARIAQQHRSKSKPYVTLLSGEYIGPMCLAASLQYRLGLKTEALYCVDQILDNLELKYPEMASEDCCLLFGKAGCLQAIFFLRQELEDPSIGRQLALNISGSILMEGLKFGGNSPHESLLVWHWHGRKLLGAATGAVGILFVLLGHTDEEWGLIECRFPRAKDVVRQAVDSMRYCVHESGNLMASLDGTEDDHMLDWSHGAPGYCHLLIRAFKVFGDDQYLEAARDIAENVIWPRRNQRKGAGLARGVSGVGYIYLALARYDEGNREAWVKCAEAIARSAIEDIHELLAPSSRPHSLFEGLGGLVAFLIDFQDPANAVFPFFGIETEGRAEAAAQHSTTSGQQTLNSLSVESKRLCPRESRQMQSSTKSNLSNASHGRNSSRHSGRTSRSGDPDKATRKVATQSETPDRPLETAHAPSRVVSGGDDEPNTPGSTSMPGLDISDGELFNLLGNQLPKFREGIGALYTFIQRLEEIADTKSRSVCHGVLKSAERPNRHQLVSSVIRVLPTQQSETRNDLSNENELASDAVVTITPNRKSRSEAMSPLSNPGTTPRRRPSPNRKMQNMAPRSPASDLNQEEIRRYKMTTPDRASLAERSTASSRAKMRETHERPPQDTTIDGSPAPPRIRRIALDR